VLNALLLISIPGGGAGRLRGTAQRAGAVPRYLGWRLRWHRLHDREILRVLGQARAGLTMMTNTFTCSISA